MDRVYTVREYRANLKQALDLAKSGETVSILRGEEVFELKIKNKEMDPETKELFSKIKESQRITDCIHKNIDKRWRKCADCGEYLG